MCHTTLFKFKIINQVIRINVYNNYFVIYNDTYKHYSDDFL